MPPKQSAPPFKADERVFCFHMDMLYEARILEIQSEDNDLFYKIHYKGWKNTWDDWVRQDRLRKFNDENKELAHTLRENVKALQAQAKGGASARSAALKKVAVTGQRTGIDSSRGSEERTAQQATSSGRGSKRQRDHDLEESNTKKVGFGLATDLVQMLASAVLPFWYSLAYEEQLIRTQKRKYYDYLTDLPPPNYRYVDAKGDTAFNTSRFRTQTTREAIHPKVIEKRRRRRADSAYEQYYQHMPKGHNIPLAGKPSAKLALIEAEEALAARKDSGKRASASENDASSALLSPPLSATSPVGINLPILPFSGSPHKGERKGSSSSTPEKEDAFQNRPSIKLVMPDHLKAMLVDDWENITKSQQLVPLPHPHPFDEVVREYMDWEIPHRPEDSAEKDLLEETMAGLREYFNRALGRILLYKFVTRTRFETSSAPVAPADDPYRFERTQFMEISEQWESPKNEGHKCPADTYGGEHLLRLLVSLPELVAQTNMDQQSVNRLREEITKFTNWLGKNYTKYFVSEYETPGPDYIEKSRSA
ncbi:hypothetical protein PspLS_05996 [Pyricularia sp. CBS 133598]|nr:hypothetical protein PspLS_05996 [Pyricularia sp. CBS 133598]